jgi:16S rRNA processing protein RimM
VLAGLTSVLIDDANHTIRSVHSRGRNTSVHLDGIADRESAAALRGALLLVRETDLPSPADDEYYRYQLIGLRVVSASGEPLGEIADIISTPGNDVFVVRGDKGEILIPAIEDVILDVDLTTGVVTIEPIPGLLPE